MSGVQVASVAMVLVCLVLLGMFLAGVDAELRNLRGLPPRQMPEPEQQEERV